LGENTHETVFIASGNTGLCGCICRLQGQNEQHDTADAHRSADENRRTKPGYSKVTYTLKKHQERISSSFNGVLAGRYDESIGDHITLEFGIQCSWLDSEKK